MGECRSEYLGRKEPEGSASVQWSAPHVDKKNGAKRRKISITLVCLVPKTCCEGFPTAEDEKLRLKS